MTPFWAQLPARLDDELGSECVCIRYVGSDEPENYRLKLRGVAVTFDEIEDLFAKHLGPTARLVWSLDVELVRGGQASACALRVEGRKDILPSVVAGTFPRPSFYIRAALSTETETLLSRWHIDWAEGFEDALFDLRAALDERATLRACYFCKWSDYEPSTTTGHLGCFRAVKARYEQIATSDDARTRKYEKESLHAERVGVDELNACHEFERRPLGFGYRG